MYKRSVEIDGSYRLRLQSEEINSIDDVFDLQGIGKETIIKRVYGCIWCIIFLFPFCLIIKIYENYLRSEVITSTGLCTRQINARAGLLFFVCLTRNRITKSGAVVLKTFARNIQVIYFISSMFRT